MLNEIRFTVFGDPVPKRYRKSVRGDWFLCKQTRSYQEYVGCNAMAAIGGKLWSKYGKYVVDINVQYSVARRRVPDTDNIVKSILDGMTRIIYWDDRLVQEHHINYEYKKSPQTKVFIHVRNLEASDHET